MASPRDFGSRTGPAGGPPGPGRYTVCRCEGLLPDAGRCRSYSACGVGRWRTDRRSSRRPGGTPPGGGIDRLRGPVPGGAGRDQAEELSLAGNGGSNRPDHGTGHQRIGRSGRLVLGGIRRQVSGTTGRAGLLYHMDQLVGQRRKPPGVAGSPSPGGRLTCRPRAVARASVPGSARWTRTSARSTPQPLLDPFSESWVNGLTASVNRLLSRCRQWLGHGLCLDLGPSAVCCSCHTFSVGQLRHRPVTAHRTGRAGCLIVYTA